MHKSQVFGYLLISFLVGVFIGAWFSNPEMATLVIILVGTIITVACGYERTFAKTKKAEHYRTLGVVMGLCILVVALGVFRYGQTNLSQSVLVEFANHQAGGKGIAVTMRGFVDGEMSIKDDKGQVIFHVTQLEVPGHTFAINERTLLFVKAYPTYTIGDTLSIVGALQLPTNFTPDFDYVQYLKNKEVRTTVLYPKILADDSIQLSWFRHAKISIYRRLFIVKDHFQSAVSRSLPEPYDAYTNGVLLGMRQNIPAELTDAFNKTSTTHILAISGYNITIIANALLFLLVFVMRRRQAFWVSVGFIILFTILTGAGASVVRAAIMGLLLLFANGYGRWYDPRNSILFAAAVMVFLDPLSLRFDVGFQLSFLAVFGLLYIYPILEQKYKKIPEFWNIKETVLMSISAQIMVAPMLAYIFHTFSLVSIPANLLVLPLMPYTMLLGFLTGVGGLIAVPLGRAVGLTSWLLSAYQLYVIRWFGSLSFSALTVTVSTFVFCFLYLLIIFAIWSIRKLHDRETS